MFDDDQETPNTLNATILSTGTSEMARCGKRKMMELEVRHWITNHEAEIGTGAYGASGVPPAGLIRTRKSPMPSSPWGRKMRKPTPSATSSTDRTVISPSTDTMHTRRGSPIRPNPAPPAAAPATTTPTSLIAFAAGELRTSTRLIEEAHISTTLVHLANASYRLGRTLKFDPAQEQVVGDDEANRLLRGTYRAPYVVPEEV